MHFLFYIPSLATGGAERVMTKLANHLVTEQHTLTLVTQTSFSSDAYTLDARVRRVSLSAARHTRFGLTTLLNNVRRVIRLRKILGRHQPDVVLSFMPTANVIALLACRPLSIPVIISERTHPPFNGITGVRQTLLRRTYPQAAHAVVLAQESAEYLEKNFSVTHVSVIPNSVTLPLPQHQPLHTPGDFCNPEHNVVLFVGRMSEEKQPMMALRVFAQVQAQNSAWRLVLIGDGPQARDVDDAIEHHPTGTVLRIPRVGNMQDWYARADIFIATSRYEGSPNALLEAMACGCAVIATDCLTGPATLITAEHNGALVPLHDEKQYTQVLSRLMSDEQLRKTWAGNATQVVENFSDTTFFARWQQVFQRVANS